MSEVAIGKRHVLVIETDEDAENPRNYEGNLGTIVATHRRYDIGEKRFDSQLYNGWEEVLRGECGTETKILYLPVYLYDHSIQILSTSSFSGRAHHAEWDSGQVGWIYTTKENVREKLGVKKITKKVKEKVLHELEREVEIYSYYFSGQTCGYILYEIQQEELSAYLKENELEREDLDFDELKEFLDEKESCWGFYGMDVTENGISEQIEPGYPGLITNLREIGNISY